MAEMKRLHELSDEEWDWPVGVFCGDSCGSTTASLSARRLRANLEVRIQSLLCTAPVTRTTMPRPLHSFALVPVVCLGLAVGCSPDENDPEGDGDGDSDSDSICGPAGPLPAEQCAPKYECVGPELYGIRNPYGENCLCEFGLLTQCEHGCADGRCLEPGMGGAGGAL